MKKLLFFLSLIVLFSCEKDNCKHCITYFYQSAFSTPVEMDRFVDCDIYIIKEQPINAVFPCFVTVCD